MNGFCFNLTTGSQWLSVIWMLNVIIVFFYVPIRSARGAGKFSRPNATAMLLLGFEKLAVVYWSWMFPYIFNTFAKPCGSPIKMSINLRGVPASVILIKFKRLMCLSILLTKKNLYEIILIRSVPQDAYFLKKIWEISFSAILLNKVMAANVFLLFQNICWKGV